MNDDMNQQILTELRKLTRSFQVMNYAGMIALVLVTALGAFVAYKAHERQKEASTSETRYQSSKPWNGVRAAMDRMDLPKALSLAQTLVARNTNDAYACSYLAGIYLEMGDTANAGANYLRAYELWPCEEYEKNLMTIRKRMARERGTPSK